ncbi:MAG: alcohol dehydrogenase, partial [Haloarculaceae archaeon]
MLPTARPFEYDHEGCRLLYGRGRIDDLGEMLAARDLDRALVVTGRHVGSNPDVVDPIEAALGDRLVGV